METLAQEGHISGKELEDRAEITDDVLSYWNAFALLSGGRQFSESGPQLLTLAEISCLLNEKNIVDPEDRDEYIYLIRRLDLTYVQHVRQKIADERQRALKKSKPSNRRSTSSRLPRTR